MNSTDSTEKPLAVAIAIATRSSHTRLNKSIIARLPLVVNAPDPSVYVTGLLHIAPIYLTFETIWQHILDAASGDESWLMVDSEPGDTGAMSGEAGSLHNAAANPDTSTLQVPEHVLHMLRKLHLPELMRSSRLRADIQDMTGWSDHVLDEQLHVAAQTGSLGDFTSHIRQSIEQRPHVLIAYSYILFMALFAGGRYMRAAFESAGTQFWQQTPSGVQPSMVPGQPRNSLGAESARGMRELDSEGSDIGSGADHSFPLRFFHFATPADGEDLRRQFKEYLSEAEQDLRQSEKDEIVQEAVCIFDHMERLVAQLDRICATFDAQESPAKTSHIGSFSTSSTGARRTHMEGSASTATGIQNLGPDHPYVSINAENIRLCPAMNSTRLDRDIAASTRAPSTEEKPRGTHSDLSFSWVLMAALGAITVGTILTVRRQMMMV